MRNTILTFAMAVCALSSGCAAVVLTSSAVVLTDEFQNKAIRATVNQNPELAWKSVKSSLGHMTDSMIHTDEDLQAAWTWIDNAQVTVHVKAWNTNESQISVTAKKVLYNHELAALIQERIVKELQL